MEQEMTLDLREIFEIIKKRLWLILIVTAASTLISGVLSYFVIPPTYEAETSIIIGKAPSTVDERIQYNDVLMYQKLVKTYSEIAKSRTVAEATSQKLDGLISPEALMKGISVTPQADTQIMVLKFQGKNPEEAANIVNTHAEVFIREAARLYPTGNVQIMDEAAVPESPVKPRPLLNMAIAFFLGIMVSLGVTFLLEYMDSTIKTEDDVEKYLGLPVIGIIPKNTSE